MRAESSRAFSFTGRPSCAPAFRGVDAGARHAVPLLGTFTFTEIIDRCPSLRNCNESRSGLDNEAAKLNLPRPNSPCAIAGCVGLSRASSRTRANAGFTRSTASVKAWRWTGVVSWMKFTRLRPTSARDDSRSAIATSTKCVRHRSSTALHISLTCATTIDTTILLNPNTRPARKLRQFRLDMFRGDRTQSRMEALAAPARGTGWSRARGKWREAATPGQSERHSFSVVMNLQPQLKRCLASLRLPA